MHACVMSSTAAHAGPAHGEKLRGEKGYTDLGLSSFPLSPKSFLSYHHNDLALATAVELA